VIAYLRRRRNGGHPHMKPKNFLANYILA
jgi:hypothetical protein